MAKTTYTPDKAKYAAGASGGGAYFLGFLGALAYYWQHANNFWLIVAGLLKAIFWPAFLVYGLLQVIGK